MTLYVAFAAIAAIGALARWQFSRLNSADWPAGTLIVNIGAAFVLGLLHETTGDALILIGVGALGSYSTFSTVVREVTEGVEVGAGSAAARYLAATLALGIGAAWLGMQLG